MGGGFLVILIFQTKNNSKHTYIHIKCQTDNNDHRQMLTVIDWLIDWFEQAEIWKDIYR